MPTTDKYCAPEVDANRPAAATWIPVDTTWVDQIHKEKLWGMFVRQWLWALHKGIKNLNDANEHVLPACFPKGGLWP